MTIYADIMPMEKGRQLKFRLAIGFGALIIVLLFSFALLNTYVFFNSKELAREFNKNFSISYNGQFAWSWKNWSWKYTLPNVNGEILSAQKIEVEIDPLKFYQFCLPLKVKGTRVEIKKVPQQNTWGRLSCFEFDVQQLFFSENTKIKQFALRGYLKDSKFNLEIPLQLNELNTSQFSVKGGVTLLAQGAIEKTGYNIKILNIDTTLAELNAWNFISKKIETPIQLNFQFKKFHLNQDLSLADFKIKKVLLGLEDRFFPIDLINKEGTETDAHHQWTLKIKLPSDSQFKLPIVSISERVFQGDLSLVLTLNEKNYFQEINNLAWKIESSALKTQFMDNSNLSLAGQWAGELIDGKFYNDKVDINIELHNAKKSLRPFDNVQAINNLILKIQNDSQNKSLFKSTLQYNDFIINGDLALVDVPEQSKKIRWSFPIEEELDISKLKDYIALPFFNIIENGKIKLENANLFFRLGEKIQLDEWNLQHLTYRDLELNARDLKNMIDEDNLNLLEGKIYSNGVLSLSGSEQSVDRVSVNSALDLKDLNLVWDDKLEKVPGVDSSLEVHSVWTPEALKINELKFHYGDQGLLEASGQIHLREKKENSIALITKESFSLHDLKSLFPDVEFPFWQGLIDVDLKLSSRQENQKSLMDWDNLYLLGRVNIKKASGVFSSFDLLWDRIDGQLDLLESGWAIQAILKNNDLNLDVSGVTMKKSHEKLSFKELLRSRDWTHDYSLELSPNKKYLFKIENTLNWLNIAHQSIFRDSDARFRFNFKNLMLNEEAQNHFDLHANLSFKDKKLKIKPLLLKGSEQQSIKGELNGQLEDFLLGGREAILMGTLKFDNFSLSEFSTVDQKLLENFSAKNSGQLILATKGKNKSEMLENFNSRINIESPEESPMTRLLSQSMTEFFEQKQLSDYYLLQDNCFADRKSYVDLAYHQGQWSLEELKYEFAPSHTSAVLEGHLNTNNEITAKGKIKIGQECFVRKQVPCLEDRQLGVDLDFELSGQWNNPELAMNFEKNQQNVLGCVDRSIASAVNKKLIESEKDSESNQFKKNEKQRSYRLQKIFSN